MSFIDKFETVFLPIASKVAEQKHLQATRDGVLLTMPLVIIGSIFLIIGFVPIEGYGEFMSSIFGKQWLANLLYPVRATMDILGLIVAFGTAYSLSEKYRVDPLTGAILSVVAFFVLIPFSVSTEVAGESVTINKSISLMYLGSKGMFVAIVSSLLSTEIYRVSAQKNLTIKMPESVPPAVVRSFSALVPGFIIITTFWIARLAVEATAYGDIFALINAVLSAPLTNVGGSLGGVLITMLAISFFWCFGIHGNAVVGAVVFPIWYALRDENRLALEQGLDVVPNIITYEFMFNFIFLGGVGGTLALAIMMAWFAKSQQLTQVGKLSIGASFFNINEPIIFGAPIMMNPILMVPFIISPLVMIILTYTCMNLGIVARPVGVGVPWTLPPIISGYLATGGKISGSVMQMVNITVSFMIFFPFFKMYDKRLVAQENVVDEKDAQLETVTS